MCTHYIMKRSLLQIKCLSCSITFQIRPCRLLSYIDDYFPFPHFPSDSDSSLPDRCLFWSLPWLPLLFPWPKLPYPIFFNPFNTWRPLVLSSTIHSLLPPHHSLSLSPGSHSSACHHFNYSSLFCTASSIYLPLVYSIGAALCKGALMTHV